MRRPGATFSLNATTRTARKDGEPRHSGLLLEPGQLISSPETQLRYRIGALLGQGGFGQVFLATRLGRSEVIPEQVCVKVSAHAMAARADPEPDRISRSALQPADQTGPGVDRIAAQGDR